MELKEILFSKSHIQNPFSYQMPNGDNLSILEKKTQIIALSVLFGVFTLGIGGVLVFYSLSAKYKVEQIKKLESQAADKILFPARPFFIQVARKTLEYLPASDLIEWTRVNKEFGAIANKKLIIVKVNSMGLNLGWDEAYLETQSANKYLSELFKSVKRIRRNHYKLPRGLCVYHEDSFAMNGFSDSEVNVSATVYNLNFLTKDQLNNLLMQASGIGDIGFVKLLLHKGADVNAAAVGRGHGGNRPLHYAADFGHLSVVKYLLEQGANAKQTNDELITPLHSAVYGGNCEIARLILEKGADIEARNARRQRPIHYAEFLDQYKMIEFLFERGAYIRDSLNYRNIRLEYQKRIREGRITPNMRIN